YTRAGDTAHALPLWQRSAQDDPTWPLLPATLGALNHDLAAAQAAQTMAAGSYLYALNTGVVADTQGNRPVALEAYQRALQLKPSSADALFWQQTPARTSALAAWRSSLPADTSLLAQGWAALDAGRPADALSAFNQALRADSNSLPAELGLGKTYLL